MYTYLGTYITFPISQLPWKKKEKGAFVSFLICFPTPLSPSQLIICYINIYIGKQKIDNVPKVFRLISGRYLRR